MARNGVDLLHEQHHASDLPLQIFSTEHMYQLVKFHLVLRDIDVPEFLRKPLPL